MKLWQKSGVHEKLGSWQRFIRIGGVDPDQRGPGSPDFPWSYVRGKLGLNKLACPSRHDAVQIRVLWYWHTLD
jgi:hypothetical protein